MSAYSKRDGFLFCERKCMLPLRSSNQSGNGL